MDKGYEAEFRVTIDNEDDRAWIKQYHQISKVTLRAEVTKPTDGRINLLKMFYLCQYKTLTISVTTNQ